MVLRLIRILPVLMLAAGTGAVLALMAAVTCDLDAHGPGGARG
jgi:hypothetical protein